MNEKSKEFRSKYFYAVRRTTLPKNNIEIEEKEFDKKISNKEIHSEKEDIEK